ncbi:11920_t:CDS:1, partial [Racocetra persica]
MESLNQFFYKIIFHKEHRDIPSNIDINKHDICAICKDVIDTKLNESVTILQCKYFFHQKCVKYNTKYLQYQEKTNKIIKNIDISHQESNCSIKSFLNFEQATISTTEFTQSTELTEPIKFNEESTELTKFIESTKTTKFTEHTESTRLPNFTKLIVFTRSAKLISAELASFFTSIESTKSIEYTEPIASMSAKSNESIEFIEESTELTKFIESTKTIKFTEHIESTRLPNFTKLIASTRFAEPISVELASSFISIESNKPIEFIEESSELTEFIESTKTTKFTEHTESTRLSNFTELIAFTRSAKPISTELASSFTSIESTEFIEYTEPIVSISAISNKSTKSSMSMSTT